MRILHVAYVIHIYFKSNKLVTCLSECLVRYGYRFASLNMFKAFVITYNKCDANYTRTSPQYLCSTPERCLIWGLDWLSISTCLPMIRIKRQAPTYS